MAEVIPSIARISVRLSIQTNSKLMETCNLAHTLLTLIEKIALRAASLEILQRQVDSHISP